MSDRAGILASVVPGAATMTRLYACGVTRSVGTITVCNFGAATVFRITSGKFADLNTATLTRRYWDVPIAANTTVVLPSRSVLENGDWIDVYALLATLTFSFDGVEETLNA
jgi:hypothetical protein